MTSTPRRGKARVVAAAALGGVLAIAAWARLADFARVLAGGEVIPVDGDSAYHQRRILYAVEHFPSLPTVDPWMSWPDGAACPWADGFDLLGAALARAAGGLGSVTRAAVAAQLLPVLLGLLVVWATMELSRLVARRGTGSRRRASGVAVAAGLVVALLPQAVASSRFGRADHHVAEALSLLLLASWALRGSARRAAPSPHPLPRLAPGARESSWNAPGNRPNDPPSPPRSGGEGQGRGGGAGDARNGAAVRHELGGAAAAAFACWMFTGGPLYVGLAAALAAARALRATRPALLGSGAPGLLAGAAGAALLALPALRQHGRAVSFQLPSLLQPVLVAAAAAGVALAVLVARRLPRAGAAARLAALAGGTLVAAVAVGLAWPAGARELASGVGGWLLRRDPWLATIQEFQPLVGGGRGYAAPLAFFFGAPGVAAPALVVAGGAWAIHRTGERGFLFAALSLALLGLSLLQNRFGRVFAPLLAVNTALALEAGGWLALRAARRQRLRSLTMVTVLAAALLAVADPRLRGMLRIALPRPLPAEAAAALDLRRAPADPPEESPGVLAPWSFGHTVSLLSGRPVVVNGFGTYLDAPTFWDVQELAGKDPAVFDAWMARRRVGYLVTGAGHVFAGAGAPGPFAATSAGLVLAAASMRSLPMSPLVIAGSGVPDAGVRHLEHLMPVFASEQLAEGLAFPLPALWAYARVPGARVRGTSVPGARIVLEIPFRERGRPHVYKAWGDAGPDGRWELVVPLPTGLSRATLHTAAGAAVRAGAGATDLFAIPEEAVRRGAAVDAPPVRRPPRG